MATQKQIQANRRNAQKSTGPKTPEGKAAVAHNALKHGLRSHDVVLPGEDPDNEFPILFEELTAEWQPETVTERMQVEELAAVFWRQRRARRIESGLYISAGEAATGKIWGRPDAPSSDQQHEVGTRILAEAYQTADAALDRVHRHQAQLGRAQARILRQLEKSKTERSNPIPPAETAADLSPEAQTERSNPIAPAKIGIDTFSPPSAETLQENPGAKRLSVPDFRPLRKANSKADSQQLKSKS